MLRTASQAREAGCIRDANSSKLEDLDIAPPSVDLQGALTERSVQIISAGRGVGAARGQRFNASIDIDRVPRASGAERGGAALHLGVSGQGAQRKRCSDRGRYPASLRPLSRGR